MALSFDGPTKIVTITTDTTLDVKDLWSRWVDWWLTGDNSKYGIAMTQVGGDDIDLGAGTSIPIYIFLVNGWKIRPKEANHTLAVVNAILVVDGGGDPFLNTIGAFTVRINYQQPVQAIGVSTGGGGGLTAGQDLKLDELHRLQGLKAGEPMVVTPTSRIAGDIELEITGDGVTETTVTRV